jgi:hypothetical protein
MLTSFLGVLPILTPPLCALAFIMCSKSNPLVTPFSLRVFAELQCTPVSLPPRHKAGAGGVKPRRLAGMEEGTGARWGGEQVLRPWLSLFAIFPPP